MSIEEVARQLNPWWADPSTPIPNAELSRRPQQREILQRLVAAESRRALLLRGPRQVGKTTLLHQCVSDLLRPAPERHAWPAANVTYFDFSDERVVARGASPREVAELVPPGAVPERPRLLLLDEVTRATGWAEWLKQAVDRHAGAYRVLATDSAAATLRDGTTESGAGRWDEIEIEGLTYPEFLHLQKRSDDKNLVDVERRLGPAFERYLSVGGFPEHIGQDSVLAVWSRLREDIADRAIRRDLAAARVDTERVRDLFVYLVQESGQILDVSKIAAGLGSWGIDVDRRSVGKWIDLLAGTMLVAKLPRRTAKPVSRMKAKPRYYASDHGLIMAFAEVFDPSEDATTRARALESMVFRHLREFVRKTPKSRLSFHRGRGDDEIDFVVDMPEPGPIAIEVKHSDPRNPSKVFQRAREIGAAKVLIVHGGLREEERAGVQLVPARQLALDADRWLTT